MRRFFVVDCIVAAVFAAEFYATLPAQNPLSCGLFPRMKFMEPDGYDFVLGSPSGMNLIDECLLTSWVPEAINWSGSQAGWGLISGNDPEADTTVGIAFYHPAATIAVDVFPVPTHPQQPITLTCYESGCDPIAVTCDVPCELALEAASGFHQCLVSSAYNGMNSVILANFRVMHTQALTRLENFKRVPSR